MHTWQLLDDLALQHIQGVDGCNLTEAGDRQADEMEDMFSLFEEPDNVAAGNVAAEASLANTESCKQKATRRDKKAGNDSVWQIHSA